MRTISTPAALCAALTCLLALPAAAAAETPASTPPATATSPATTPATLPASTPPAAGRIKLALPQVGGKPLFAGVGRRIVVRGTVTPYVAGQSVKLSVTRDGRRIFFRTVSVLPVANGTGQFRVNFSSASAGVVQVQAAHAASATQLAFTGRSANVRVVNESLGVGASGASVRLLQSELAALHYAVPLNGVLDEATGRALVAYRKLTGLERIPFSGSQVFSRISGGAGAFHVRYRRDGRHIEANLTAQVLAEIEPGGRVRAIYTMSSGKPSTPTVLGRFRVYRKEPGINSHGMVDSSYFISGYAIHGYAEVPTYAASHGCLRIPIPDASAVYGWAGAGTPVDVYN
jgi:hypothetical protein